MRGGCSLWDIGLDRSEWVYKGTAVGGFNCWALDSLAQLSRQISLKCTKGPVVST